MRRVLVLMPVFILLVLVSGCGHQGNPAANHTSIIPVSEQDNSERDNTDINAISEQGNADIDIPDIISKQRLAMKEVSSCRANVYLEINMKSGASDKSDISVTANMKSSIDSKNRKLSSIISTTLVRQNSKQEMEQRIIADGNTIYLKDNRTSAAKGHWQVKTLERPLAEKLWNEQETQLTGSKYSGLMNSGDFTYGGKEKANGRTCLVLKQSLEPERIAQISPEMKEQLQSAQGFVPEQLEKMIEKAEISCLIDEQTFYLREFRLDAQINQEVQGKQIAGSIKQYCRFDAFNEPVSIQVPEDIE